MKRRFASVSEAELNEKRRYLVPPKTEKSNNSAANILRDFLKEKDKDTHFEQLSKKELDEVLASFYINARTKDGNLYKKTSLESIRYGLNRFLKSQVDIEDKFDIIDDAAFVKSNESFKIALKEIKKEGRAAIEHHEPISDTDRQKLYSSLFFNPQTPTGLFNKVQYDVRYYFARRGAENMHTMLKSSFVTHTNPETGLRFITKRDELTKNHRGNDPTAYSGFIPETGTDDCPFKSFKKYVSKLHPEQERLWCKSRSSFKEDDDTWYTKTPVGVNSLQKFLPRLSEKCGLSQIYKNHCIRVTTATLLHQEKFSMGEVQSITGHKSISSLAVYQRTSTDQKHEMANTLHQRVAGGKENRARPENSNSSNDRLNVADKGRLHSNAMGTGHDELDKGDLHEIDDLDFIFSDINEPREGSHQQALFRNCTLNIQNFNINIVRK